MNLLRKENMFSLESLEESKFFTRVTLVLFVLPLCRTGVAHVVLVLLMSYSCCTHVARASHMSHLCCSCRTRVARVWHSCCKIDQIKVKHQPIWDINFGILPCLILGALSKELLHKIKAFQNATFIYEEMLSFDIIKHTFSCSFRSKVRFAYSEH